MKKTKITRQNIQHLNFENKTLESEVYLVELFFEWGQPASLMRSHGCGVAFHFHEYRSFAYFKSRIFQSVK